MHITDLWFVHFLGSCCWFGEEPGPNGIHQRRQSTQPNLGISGGVEYGEPGRDCTISNFKVSPHVQNIENVMSYDIIIVPLRYL